MTKLNLDLGKSYKDSMPHDLASSKDDLMYPEFTIESDEAIDLPHEGVMVIEYRKKSSEEREDDQGNEHYSCRICVKRVVKVKSAKVTVEKDSALDSEDALDKLAKAKMAKKSSSSDEGEDY